MKRLSYIEDARCLKVKIHSSYHTLQFQPITQHSTQHIYYRTQQCLIPTCFGLSSFSIVEPISTVWTIKQKNKTKKKSQFLFNNFPEIQKLKMLFTENLWTSYLRAITISHFACILHSHFAVRLNIEESKTILTNPWEGYCIRAWHLTSCGYTRFLQTPSHHPS